MHGDVDLAGGERLLDLAGKEPLAADLLERAVLHPVAGGLDHRDLERRLGQIERLPKPAACLVRLRERKRRAARADLEGAGRGGQVLYHACRFRRATRA